MNPLKTIVLFLLIFTNSSFGVEYRLPDIVVLTFYDLSLTINPENTDYSGVVIITLHTANQTKDVYVHSDTNFIQINRVILNNNAKCDANILDVTDMVRISCSRALIIDQDNSIYIEFTSKLSVDDGFGLSRSSYLEGKNEQFVIESNFKPTYARRAFPCMDEPDFKAGFAVQITHPKDYTALSNSPAISSQKSSADDLQTTRFEDTPEISTHLLTILLSKFQEAETSNEKNVDFKIFTRAEVSTLTKNVAETYYHKIIEQLDSYTGVPYQNLSEAESYLVAVPDYSDATGDFGLFTYRETDLLDEGDKTTTKAKQDIITAMAYKLSHEWYGGDVATTWWSDIWANEAVATYLKYIIPDKVDDELELMNQFLLEVTQKMLTYDAYSFAQPLSSKESEINNEWTIENKLNTATFEKGASILHMIRHILRGEDNFQTALQGHLQNRKEAETDGTDILKDLLDGKGDDRDYNFYLQNWVFSAGYPMLTVMLQEVDDTVNIANVTQKRFIYPTSDVQVKDDSVWYVPLTSVTLWNHPIDERVDVFLEPDEHMMYFFGSTWILFNTRGGYFYRVNYDEILWRRLLDGWNSSRLDFHVLERAQVIDDIFNIARIGDVSYSLAFELANFFVEETDYYPWYSILNVFSYLLGKMENNEVELNLKNYILGLMENVIVIPGDSFVEDNDTHIDVFKKVMILKWACKLGHEECINYTIEKFNNYKTSQASLDDYNAREVVFCNGIRHSEHVQEDWDFLWNVYSESSSVHEQNDILNALGCAEDKDILQKYLTRIITTDSGIKRQDALVVFKSIFSSSVGLQAARDFLDNSLSDVQNFFQDMRFLSEMIYVVAEELITDGHGEWLKSLLSDKVLDDYEDVKSKANTLVSVNNYWQKNFRDQVTNIFPSTATTTESTLSTNTDASTITDGSTITDASTITEGSTNTDDGTSTDSVTTTEPSTTTESKSDRMSISINLSLFFLLLLALN